MWKWARPTSPCCWWFCVMFWMICDGPADDGTKKYWFWEVACQNQFANVYFSWQRCRFEQHFPLEVAMFMWFVRRLGDRLTEVDWPYKVWRKMVPSASNHINRLTSVCGVAKVIIYLYMLWAAAYNDNIYAAPNCNNGPVASSVTVSESPDVNCVTLFIVRFVQSTSTALSAQTVNKS